MARRTIEQVDAEARAEFELDLAISKLPLLDKDFQRVTQENLDLARRCEWQRLHPGGKQPKDVGKLLLSLGDEVSAAVVKPYAERMDEHYAARKKAHDEAEARMRELAPDIILHHQPDGRTWIEVERVSDSCYSNQTQSKHYSQVSAELRADGYRKHATVRVVERDRYFVTEAALPDELEVEVLRRLPGLTLREWMKRCMQLGANPRVYSPFLPHGTEERMGWTTSATTYRPSDRASLTGHDPP